MNQEKTNSFLETNKLEQLLKQLTKASNNAVQLLTELVNDTEQDKKTRIDAAKYLIDKRIEVSNAISKDTLTRLVAEHKINGAPKNLKTINSEEDEGPSIDFDNVRKIPGASYSNELDKETDTYDLSNVESL